MSVTVVFPEELLIASREERDDFARNVMIDTLGRLYAQGKISSGIAAQVLECDRLEFYRLVSARGFSVIDYPPEELDAEVQSSTAISDEIGRK